MWALQEKQKKHLQGVEDATIILIIGHVISSKAIATGNEDVLVHIHCNFLFRIEDYLWEGEGEVWVV